MVITGETFHISCKLHINVCMLSYLLVGGYILYGQGYWQAVIKQQHK